MKLLIVMSLTYFQYNPRAKKYLCSTTVLSCTQAKYAQTSILLLKLHVNAVLSTEFLHSPLLHPTNGKHLFEVETI